MSDQSVRLQAGISNVGSYQVSGIPFLSGNLTAPSSSATPVAIQFPSVTQKIIIHNNCSSDYPLRIGFSANGVKGTNYWLVEAHGNNGKSNDRIELRVKATKLYMLGHDASHNTTGIYVAAELTGIQGYDLASALSGSAGIG
jgi:hypothetical protein